MSSFFSDTFIASTSTCFFNVISYLNSSLIASICMRWRACSPPSLPGLRLSVKKFCCFVIRFMASGACRIGCLHYGHDMNSKEILSVLHLDAKSYLTQFVWKIWPQASYTIDYARNGLVKQIVHNSSRKVLYGGVLISSSLSYLTILVVSIWIVYARRFFLFGEFEYTICLPWRNCLSII